MRKIVLGLLILSAIIFASQLYFYLVGNYNPFDVIYVVLAVFATLSIALVASKAKSESDKKILKLFALGLLLYATGDGLWMYYEIIQGIEVPFPSLADVAWLLGYVPILMGFYQHRKGLFIASKKKKGFYALSAIFLILSIYVLAINVLGAGIFESVINTLYIAFDFLIIYFYLFTLLSNEPGSLLKPWIRLATGFLIFSAFDIGFAWLTATGRYYTGSPIDLIYSFGYLYVAYAAYSLSRTG